MDFEIPGYDIIERIGSGGMASVYRASQQTFQRDVALKVLRQDLGSDEKYSERFVQESQIIAKLHHSHIVQVYDVGQFKNLFYVAMEFLSGRNLSEMLRQQRVDRTRAVRIFSQIASALDYSHQKGIVHRDVKPDNIMFRDDGAAVLTDFGIAKDTDASMELTQTGTIMGTPKYMSPEQIRGGTVSPSSDLYSLGVVFYQMLTGNVPYTGSTLVEVAVKHLNEPIPTLPEGLTHFQAIFDKVLAKKPEDRYHRGNEILQDLAKVEHQNISVLLNAEAQTEPFPASGGNAAPKVNESDLDNQDSIDNTITNHDGVTLLSLEGIEPGIDATTIRTESPVSGRYKAVPASNADVAIAFGDDSTVAELPPQADPVSAAPANKDLGQTSQDTAKPAKAEKIDTSQWEYLFDTPEQTSPEAQTPPKTNWTLYSGFAIALIILVVIISWLAPSLGPGEIPQLDARQKPALTQAPETSDSPPETEVVASSADDEAANTTALPENSPPTGVSAIEPATSADDAEATVAAVIEPEVKPNSEPVPSEAGPTEAELLEQQATIQRLLTSARRDERNARLTQPLGNNALVKFRQVLALEPSNDEARRGIARIAEHFVANAEQIPSKENMGIAYSVLSDARDASPGNPFLRQIGNRLKVVTDNTRASANHADSLYRKLQVQGLLRSAEIDEREGRLISPAHNNALDKYRKVLDLDPENQIAAERLQHIEQ